MISSFNTGYLSSCNGQVARETSKASSNKTYINILPRIMNGVYWYDFTVLLYINIYEEHCIYSAQILKTIYVATCSIITSAYA